MANPLTLIMPLKEGVDVQKLAQTLAAAAPQINAALTSIGTVHFARFVVFDASSPNLQPASANGPFRLAVITEYDKSFDSYIQDFVNKIGGVFDVLLSFTADGESLIPVSKNVKAFTAYVAKNDASQHLPPGQEALYSAYPQTVQKILAAFPSTEPSQE
jgi:hypothetical protein